MMRDRGIIYQPNGSGRDTYIYNDSGGFNRIKEPRQQFHPGSVALGLPGLDYKKFFLKEKHPHIHSKPIQYPEDGSGRDYYIKVNNGGLSQTSKNNEYRMAFKNSLRNYNQIPFYLERRNYSHHGKGTSTNLSTYKAKQRFMGSPVSSINKQKPQIQMS